MKEVYIYGRKILTKEEIVEDFKDNLVSNDEIEGNDDSSSYGEDEERKLVTDKQDPDVASLYGRYTRNKLILQPDYQRKFVMKQAVASRLIESMLLGIPLPVVYFAEEEDGSYSVIDGQQRLTAIISFINGKFLYDDKPFRLSSLNVLTDLNRKSWGDLTDVQREKY